MTLLTRESILYLYYSGTIGCTLPCRDPLPVGVRGPPSVKTKDRKGKESKVRGEENTRRKKKRKEKREWTRMWVFDSDWCDILRRGKASSAQG